MTRIREAPGNNHKMPTTLLTAASKTGNLDHYALHVDTQPKEETKKVASVERKKEEHPPQSVRIHSSPSALGIF